MFCEIGHLYLSLGVEIMIKHVFYFCFVRAWLKAYQLHVWDKYCRLTVYLRLCNCTNLVSIVKLFIAHTSLTILEHMPKGSQTLPIPPLQLIPMSHQKNPSRQQVLLDCGLYHLYLYVCDSFSSSDLRAGGTGSHPRCDTEAVSDAMEKCLLTFSLFISPALLPLTHPQQVNTPPAHTTFLPSLVLFSAYSLSP